MSIIGALQEIIKIESEIIQIHLIHYGKLYKKYKELQEEINNVTSEEAATSIMTRRDAMVTHEDQNLANEIKKILPHLPDDATWQH